ncbi:TonB-dependent receptor [Sandaracinobacteroides hominis]|uniref:TonB-dependent receptor n=1 Tax=Sandaracinobacteroides hominis TaxID=2780086 RepID=UPI001F3F04A6|nr:TonB-dependent receptor [Sandaracinobacteroides hominis]
MTRPATFRAAARWSTALALVLSASAAFAQTAGEPADTQAAEDIIVTGFRASLGAALDIKRDSVTAVDAIVAEDIAKFPDQNLAESLQRIPGITIQRDGGEGRAITVRGLGPQFTRVRVNGMETIATSNDGASSNRDRSFDFNVFASELFSSIVVHKTAEASLDEGSLGAIIDLNTGNPMGGKDGITVVGAVQGAYNDLSKNVSPRLSGLLSWKSPDGTFGASVSAAYQKSDTLELGNNTVRWAQARFDSVNGQPCFFNSNTGTTPVRNSGGFYQPSAICDQAALAFHPRIPRYGEVRHERERLGMTGSLQWSPTEATKVSIDGLFSSFKETRTEKWGEVLLRSNERSIDVVNFKVDDNNNMIAATLNDAWVRTEHFQKVSKTKFYQVGVTWDQDLSDTFRFTAMGGISQSDADVPKETTFVFDDRDAQNYQYDYTDMRRPRLTFGTSVTDASNFQLAEIRDRPSNVTNKFRTAQLRTEWDLAEDFTVKTGVVWRKFTFDSTAFTRDTVVCPTGGGKDLVLGTLTCTASSVFGPTAVYGFAASGLEESFKLGNAGQPSGTTNEWLIPNLDKSADFTKLYDRTPVVDAGNTRSVSEEVSGGYLQFDMKGSIFGLEYRANAGIRYVKTSQTSTGLSSGTPVTVDRTYEDWLPSMNVALFPAEDLIIRGSIANVMTRPTLANLTPGGSVDGFNYRVNFGNPFLDPFRATAYDLAVEWYFAPDSIFSVAWFRKDISSFPIADVRSGTFASTGLPTSIIPPGSPAAQNPEGQLWTINSIVNGTGGWLQGVELSAQAPFTFLPGFLSRFGGIVNATFIGSSATYSVAGPTIVPCVRNPTNPNAACTFGANVNDPAKKGDLFNLSQVAWNATLYYEDAKFSARASLAKRGGYNDANSGTGNIFEGYASQINVDASMRYKVTENIELSLEGNNLTDAYRNRISDAEAQRNYESNHFGRTITFGARFNM